MSTAGLILKTSSGWQVFISQVGMVVFLKFTSWAKTIALPPAIMISFQLAGSGNRQESRKEHK